MYNYKLLNNHYVVEIDGHHYIIDTGYPFSVTFRSDLNMVKVNNRFYPLSPAGYSFNIQRTHQLVGFPVDGLLGLDVFQDTGLTFYKDNENGGRVDFASHDINGIKCPIISLLGGYAPIINVNGNKLFLVDTGAKYGYGSRNMFNGLTPYAEVDDYNPTLGELKSPIYHTSIKVKEKECPIDVCYNPRVTFQVPNFLMVGNITTLFNKECCINYREMKIIFN